MSYMHVILLSIFITYCVSILILIIGWLLALKNTVVTLKNERINKISVLIPFRNEEENIESLIKSLAAVNYAQDAVEFIFINDSSTDKGEEYLEKSLNKFPFSFQIVNLTQGKEGKKNALKMGVLISKNSHIVTTDADCTFSVNWLSSINHSINNGCDFIIGAVINGKKSGILANVQQIEALMLAGVTIGSAYLKKPLLCSGANLAYSKYLFDELIPYSNHPHILSGDDMFFLEKVVRHNGTIGFVNDSVVETKAAETIKGMFFRSVRWASKSGKINLILTSIFSAIILITNYSMLFILGMLFLADDSIVFFIKLCGIKTIIDVLFLILLANRYNRYEAILYFPLMVVYYPFYILIVSVASIFTSPKWKGR